MTNDFTTRGQAARLVHGTSVNSGILQVQTDGSRWGYVCDDSFDQDDFGAQVASHGRVCH
jgi:hypothetical protein